MVFVEQLVCSLSVIENKGGSLCNNLLLLFRKVLIKIEMIELGKYNMGDGLRDI